MPTVFSKCFFVWETRSSRSLQVYFIPLWISICTSPGTHLWGCRNHLFPDTNISGTAGSAFVQQSRLLHALKAIKRRDTHKKSFADFFFPSKSLFLFLAKWNSRMSSKLEWNPELDPHAHLPFPSTVTRSSWAPGHLSFLIYKYKINMMGKIIWQVLPVLRI